MNPRRAALAGIVFAIVAVIYWVAATVLNDHVDFAGITLLFALGAAMSLMAYVLFASLKRN